MYRIRDIEPYLEVESPDIILRSRNKMKFRTPATRLTKVMKSCFYRGVKLWERSSLEEQRATTKVKFKHLIE